MASSSSFEKCDNDSTTDPQNTNRDSSSSPQSDSSGEKIILPSSLSGWKREDILKLRININYISSLNTPQDIVRRVLSSPMKHGSVVMQHLDARVVEIAKDIRKMWAFELLNSPIENLTSNNMVVLATRDDAWQFQDVPDAFFKASFYHARRDFTETLLQCIERCEAKENVSKLMYQHLFIRFLGLFGIRCQFEPGVRKMKIRGQNISGSPDIVANWFRVLPPTEHGSFEWKTLFITEVKKDFTRDDQPERKRTRLLAEDTGTQYPVKPIPDGLLGQHGGELLMYLKSSIAKDNILGMLVEKTNVTFTSLSATEAQYNQILESRLRCDRTNGPEIIYTKSYNYLLKPDRDRLIEPLLKLGLIQNQNYGKEFFS